METDNYPGNKDIQLQRKTILELEKTNDWKATAHAKTDLYDMVCTKDRWLKHNT